ncbi:antitoxin (DNA-binding transcriptional repressor) of toxin-antitoxin stability system [Rhodococcus sp. OAS809]|uniref:hypothetical protein n=1 Tax=Rhodococcus sp. OAS809 TaxID=2663874 RepID=UPI001789981F
MTDTNDPAESAERPFNLIPLDQAPGLVLRMLARFAEGLPEPMVIGAGDRPVAALIPIEDLNRLREYDRRALNSEELFYSELDQRIQSAEAGRVVSDLDSFAQSLGSVGEQWANRRPSSEQG